MPVRFTKTTRLILNHIQTFGFITNKQCALIYYKNNKQSLVQAQVKNRQLFESGYIKRYENPTTRELIYCSDTSKEISEHKIITMNLYAYIMNKYEVIHFKLEPSWGVSKRRSDAHIIFKKENNETIGLLLEVDLFHQTTKFKLDELYKSGEVQQFYEDEYKVSNYYPSTLIINALGKGNIKNTEYDIVYTDFNFNGLSDIL